MAQWPPLSTAAGLEAEMANKDKGGKSSKKVAVKSLKEKRQDKKGKRDASDRKQIGLTK
jgi:hypothetical protein